MIIKIGMATVATIGIYLTIAKLLHGRTRIKYDLVENFSYAEAIKYLVEHEPPVPFEKGVIMRRGRVGAYTICLVFLDNKEKLVSQSTGIPYGRFIKAKHLDQELLDAFGDEDIIIVS